MSIDRSNRWVALPPLYLAAWGLIVAPLPFASQAGWFLIGAATVLHVVWDDIRPAPSEPTEKEKDAPP